MANITCECCGGTDFYKEAGFYFCSECQTQTQELQEQEFDLPNNDTTIVQRAKKLKTSSKESSTNVEQITSWECYNYILLGLVNELIELGADVKLKPIVQTLWFKYLRKIEVLHENVNQPPSLPAYNNKFDAKIIYGRKSIKKVYKRKRRSSCSSTGTNVSGESSVSKREQARLKRSMAEAAYEQMSSQQSESSVLNTSLGSLKSSLSDSQKKKHGHLNFSREAKKELLNHMTKNHLKQHIHDTESALTCHDVPYRKLSSAYKVGPHVMNKSKLYVILYVGLLIIKDEMQLGDIIRFISEGTLSFNFYQHFFPEELESQATFIHTLQMTKVYSFDVLRSFATKFVNYLQISEDIPQQNIVQLVTRYCKELNLPTGFCNLCVNLIAELQPKLQTTHLLPNYEARAMCIIIFVLKLLFGLDDKTEYKLSQFAREINDKVEDSNCFIFETWLKMLCYRRCILAKYHFPTLFARGEFSCANYLNFINEYFRKYDIQQCESMDYDVISNLLFKSDYEKKNFIEFLPSLTPIHNNIQVLRENGVFEQSNYQTSLLLADFKETTIDFLLHPEKFLPSGVEIHPGGANNKIKVVPIYNVARPYNQLKSLITCELSNNCKIPELSFTGEIDTQNLLKRFQYIHNHETVTIKNGSNIAINYKRHYSPEKRFWLRLSTAINNIHIKEFDDFLKTFPYTFQLILRECAAILQQTVKELLHEYNNFEVYVCYKDVIKLLDQKNKKSKIKAEFDHRLLSLIKAARAHW